ncbi:hypothetical protein GCM10011297_20610 [Bacterioplanes sanyensis]|uniref:class I SAM-dependent methyltransferase n=1 Tax=Bacterioplanes sanyensis TaxID=1249553 RepID=UPI00167443CA|nr:class I SAM-dependent methyltransferase [Bacterioplanes sanyensis]GGY47658.1 hypothetical protein GCM10011297_20610 [Bacterioplanes sanyensis]
MSATELTRYYAQRAQEYDRIYDKPERQQDLRVLEQQTTQFGAGQKLLEIACGTGYWTQFLSQQAKSVTAIDYNQEVLDIACQRDYANRSVYFVRDDAYTLNQLDEQFEAAFVGFWWSHVPLQRIAEFLHALHAKLKPGATVWIMDNRYVEGSSTPISHSDDAGNTYQTRPLDDGSQHEILKIFPSSADLEQQLSGVASSVKVTELTYFWLAEYQINQ